MRAIVPTKSGAHVANSFGQSVPSVDIRFVRSRPICPLYVYICTDLLVLQFLEGIFLCHLNIITTNLYMKQSYRTLLKSAATMWSIYKPYLMWNNFSTKVTGWF